MSDARSDAEAAQWWDYDLTDDERDEWLALINQGNTEDYSHLDDAS